MAPVIFTRTTIGTETLIPGVGGNTCNPDPPVAGATISCTFTNVGDLLAGANTDRAALLDPRRRHRLTGTVTAASGGTGSVLIQKSVAAINGNAPPGTTYPYGLGTPVSVTAGDRVTFLISVYTRARCSLPQ